MPIETTTQVIDDSDGTTVIDTTVPYVTMTITTDGYAQSFYFASFANLSAWAAAQQATLDATLDSAVQAIKSLPIPSPPVEVQA